MQWSFFNQWAKCEESNELMQCCVLSNIMAAATLAETALAVAALWELSGTFAINELQLTGYQKLMMRPLFLAIH